MSATGKNEDEREPTVEYVEYIKARIDDSDGLIEEVAEVIHAAWCGVEDCGRPSREELTASIAAIHAVLAHQVRIAQTITLESAVRRARILGWIA